MHLENEVLNGMSGIKKAIAVIQTHLDKIPDESLENILVQAKSLFRNISPRTLNFIAINNTYKTDIKTWNEHKIHEGKEISNTPQHVAGLISAVEERLNKSILTAKKSDTKKKREMEKKIVMNFYKTNIHELKKIFDLQNLLIRAKNMVSEN